MKRRVARKIKRQIQGHGSVVVSRAALEEWTGETLRNPLGRKKAAKSLQLAGLSARPPLKALTPMDTEVHLFLRGEAPDPGEPLPTDAPALGEREAADAAKKESERREAGMPPRVPTRRETRANAKQAQSKKVKRELSQLLDRAASAKNMAAQELALAEALGVAQRRDGAFDKSWSNWLNRQIVNRSRSGRLKRGTWLGYADDVQIFSDRVCWSENGRLEVRPVDGQLRASLDTAGGIEKRPTLTRMAFGSVLPGTALIPGLAFQKKTDRRELFFVLEHPEWAVIRQLDPNATAEVRQLVVATNQAAAKAGLEKEAQTEKAGATGTRPVRDGPEYIEELRQLSQLRDEGVLTEDEFVRRKAQILSRPT